MEALCSAIALYRLGFDDVQENGIQTPIYKSVQNNRGEIIDRDFVGFKKNPAVSTMDAAIRQIRSLSSELGLTPTSRASLLSLTADNDDDDGPSLADVLSGGDSW